MPRLFSTTFATTAALLLLAGASHAQQLLYNVTLTGSQEIPANASTAIGSGSVLFNSDFTSMTVNLTFSNLTAPATGSHIHISPSAGTNGPIVFNFSGTPNATSGSLPPQVFAVSPAQLSSFFSNLWYMNVHDNGANPLFGQAGQPATYAGGEIRGNFIVVSPEPGSIAFLGMGVLPLVGMVARRRKTARPNGSIKRITSFSR